MTAKKTSEKMTMRVRASHTLNIMDQDGRIGLMFDLEKVRMSKKQKATVLKLFSQEPVALVADEEHLYSRERGKTGPGSKYLTRIEFESIRQLGVRLGTQGELAALACDFCLHCVKLDALPHWQTEIR